MSERGSEDPFRSFPLAVALTPICKTGTAPSNNGLLPRRKGETDDYPIQHAERTTRAGAKASMDKADHTLVENSDENLDGKLDQALEETFPTSDPISVKITK